MELGSNTAMHSLGSKRHCPSQTMTLNTTVGLSPKSLRSLLLGSNLMYCKRQKNQIKHENVKLSEQSLSS